MSLKSPKYITWLQKMQWDNITVIKGEGHVYQRHGLHGEELGLWRPNTMKMGEIAGFYAKNCSNRNEAFITVVRIPSLLSRETNQGFKCMVNLWLP